MKYSSKIKNYELTVVVKTTGEKINIYELNRASQILTRGFLQPSVMKDNKIQYSGPAGISLYEKLQKPISRVEFIYIMEQIIVVAKKLRTNNMGIHNLVMDLQNVYINEKTRELNFIYIPTVDGMENPNLLEFIRTIYLSAKPSSNEDAEIISRFAYFFQSLKPFNIDKLEEFLVNEDSNIVNIVKRTQNEQSGFMTNKPMHYYEHYEEKNAELVEPVKPDESAYIENFEDDNSTALLYEEDSTGLLYQEESTGLLYENESTALLYEDESTSLLYDDERVSEVKVDYATNPSVQEYNNVTENVIDEDIATSLLYEDVDTGLLMDDDSTWTLLEDEDDGTALLTEPPQPPQPQLPQPPQTRRPDVSVNTSGYAYASPPKQVAPVDQPDTMPLWMYQGNGNDLDDTVEETGLLIDDSFVRFPTLTRIFTGEVIEVNKPVFRLGKEKSYVDYFVNNNIAVSRSHADIITRGNKYFVKDLNSKNHTYINTQQLPIHMEFELHDGDYLRLGNEEFIFKISKP